MNPNNEQVPVPPQPHRSSFSCDRHPTEQFNGFCPVCLCERLTTLELSTDAVVSSSSSRRPSALKGLFRGPSKQNLPQQLHPELLRRTQSFSASKNEGFSGVLEPQRHSCDVRGRSTLSSLFSMDHHQLHENNNSNIRKSSASLVDQQGQIQEEHEESHDEIRACEDVPISVPGFTQEVLMAQDDQEQQNQEEVKTIKDHIDLDSQPKKPSSSSGMDLKEIAGNFWSAASVFTKKWQKWRQNQKLKKRQDNRRGGPTLPVEKPISRQYRETQSEIADYGFGRRSCDTDPRFSLDVPRMSFDDVRPSFDQPRASWDGHLMGANRGSFPRLPPILSVVEDSPAPIARSDVQIRRDIHVGSGDGHMSGSLPWLPPIENSPTLVARSDMQIPTDPHVGSSDGNWGVLDEGDVPGGSAQTREYYSDSSRRRKSLDRSSSIRKTAAAVVAEMDEANTVTNAKVAPGFVEHRVSVDSNPNLFRDDCSETFELGFRDNGTVIGERKGLKKSRRWKNIWGLIVRRTKDEDERYERGNGVERSFSSSWQELRRERNGETRARLNKSGSIRSNVGSFGSVNGRGLERNRSARYSPNHVENGLLRFYLTPLKGSCRKGGGGMGKSKVNNSHSIARSVLRLY